MKLTCITPTRTLNKAYLKESIQREDIERLKANLITLFERIKPGESEEHLKNLLADFLKDTWYKPAYEINTSGRADLVIHNGPASTDPVGVLFEVKRPDNSAEMISLAKPNTKALHELLSYYLNERYLKDNKQLKRLIVCNIYEWYIFDAADFERFFFANKKLVQGYKQWKEGLFGLDKTDWFYQELAKPFIEKELTELPCTVVNLKEFIRIARKPDSAEERRLVTLYKLLSPQHLLKLPFANDSNLLNREFYGELLHLIGLEEVKDKGKKLIRRKSAERRNGESLLENSIGILKTRHCLDSLLHPEQYGVDEEEQLFSVGLELCITWLNRLLFLKLLEGQLVLWHRGDRRQAFLNSGRISDFDELNELFFEVLAMRPAQRGAAVQAKFGAIPYLNSSLFEESELERATIRINELKNRLNLPLYPGTVLKEDNGKRRGGEKNTLGYLFEFLDAYDFASEGSAEIQEQSKTLINASVLGLIFEKINGYRDGSFFTPGFITMYMSRETIRRAVLQKFKESYGWMCRDLTELHNRIDPGQLKEANAVVDSLKICDPAVGSGHFLVSALNEIIAIKSELGILSDRDDKRLRDYAVTVENDELIIACEDQLFAYNPKDPESRRVQETLFFEKATIIENCLFGVDINPKSVAICRLRLWIELLKNAYYTKESGYTELETLPNIDINIKCGNSLVSRFALNDAESKKQRSPVEINRLITLTDKYREKVWEYKLAPANKTILRRQIEQLKEDLSSFALPTDRDQQTLRAKQDEYAEQAFAFDKVAAKKREKLGVEIEELEAKMAEKRRTLYFNAFEWRFEFPEVLDKKGSFVGFDAVIGNPPYIPIEQFGNDFRTLFHSKYPQIERKYDSSVLFFIEGTNLLTKGGILSFIAPLTWQTGDNYTKLRKHLIENKGLFRIINLPFDIFEDAYVDTGIYFISAERRNEFEMYSYDKKARVNSFEDIAFVKIGIDSLDKSTLKLSAGGLGFELSKKLSEEGYVRLGDITKSTQGLAGSRFVKIELEEPNAFPFLEKGNVYNYLLVKEKICTVDMSDKPSLSQFYQAEPKVLIRRIINRQDRLSVAYTEEKLAFKKDINPFIPTDNRYSAKYLLAILASAFISYRYVNSSVIATKDDFRQTTLSELRALPIPVIQPEAQASIIVLVDQIIAAKAADPQADTRALEGEIDALVYQLYGLTPEEIAIVEQGATKGGGQ